MTHAEDNIDVDGILADQFPQAREITPEEWKTRKEERNMKKLEKAREMSSDTTKRFVKAIDSIDVNNTSLDEVAGKLADAVMWLETTKFPTHTFQMEQVLYDKTKFFQCTLNVMHALDETERAYNLFFHIREMWLFGAGDIDNKENEKLVSAIVLKVENKHWLTKLTCSIQPDDAYWLMSKVFSFNSNWVVSLIPTNALNTVDTAKVKEMID